MKSVNQVKNRTIRRAYAVFMTAIAPFLIIGQSLGIAYKEAKNGFKYLFSKEFVRDFKDVWK